MSLQLFMLLLVNQLVDKADNPVGVAFSSDGTKMYIMDNSNLAVYQYTLSTAWNVSTASYASLSISVSSQSSHPTRSNV